MTECYKLLFDLSLYYTLSGFYLSMIFGTRPSPWGFLLLAGAVLADAVLRAGKERTRAAAFAPLLLPILILLTRPGLWQLVQLVPGWVYLGWCLLTGRTDTDYFEAYDHFSFGVKLLLLLLPGLPFWGKLPAALGCALPYLILMLALGVCLLRMLREQRRQGLRQAVYIAAFLALCTGLTLGQAPQLLLKGVGILYRSVLSPILFLLAIAFGLIGYGFYLLLKWLISLRKGEPEQPELNLRSVAEDLGLTDAYESYLADLSWLKTVGILLAAGLAVIVLVLIFRRLLGQRRRDAGAADGGERVERLLRPNGKRSPTGLLRPRDPRLAVRYYYAKYLEECRRRGLSAPEGMTAQELAEASAGIFPGADPEKLARVYAPARYSSRAPVSRGDAEAAAALWRELKHSGAKDAE